MQSTDHDSTSSTIMGAPKRKASSGRRKVEMKRIDSKDALQVCFSKRRSGLFKKCTELSILCGAEIGVVVFSPAGKPFSYGHPSVESIIDRYLSGAGGSSNTVGDPHRRYSAAGDAIIEQHAELTKMIDAFKKRNAMLEMALESRGRDGSVGSLGLEDLVTLRQALEDLKNRIHHMIRQPINFVPDNDLPFAPPNYNDNPFDFFGGSGMITTNRSVGSDFFIPFDNNNNEGTLMAVIPPPATAAAAAAAGGFCNYGQQFF